MSNNNIVPDIIISCYYIKYLAFPSTEICLLGVNGLLDIRYMVPRIKCKYSRRKKMAREGKGVERNLEDEQG